MSLVEACNNFVVLLVEKYNGLLWYLVLFYGASKFELRGRVFAELEDSLRGLNHSYLIVGDFNQVDYGCDKLSINKNYIRGACDFNNWKLRNELLDIPFKGPRFTWCNNRKGEKRVYEWIDKALGSKGWFTIFLETGIKHYPIQISDHAPIEVDLNLTKNNSKKPYKLDAWVLDYSDCIQVIKEVWSINDVGSPAFRVVRKLARVRQSVKKRALDKRNDWSGKWDDFDKVLEHGIELATTGGGEEVYNQVNEKVRDFATAAAIYWKQRAKLKWMVVEDTLPKCDNLEDVKDYRPISLCNVFMRIVTKCITNRLKKVMGYLVGEYQNAFLAGRSISDNIFLAHEAIHRVNAQNKGKYRKFAFKADTSKAYDRVKWDFLQAVLQKFGFWIDWLD
ncbi:uncharacterized protein LOC141585787 [Silene latifolia]|uniref:uncharacterized protein LOC141585787 n=1 Tax=Silene latifolia TaxID=37657 RepID=UPI003D788175